MGQGPEIPFGADHSPFLYLPFFSGADTGNKELIWFGMDRVKQAEVFGIQGRRGDWLDDQFPFCEIGVAGNNIVGYNLKSVRIFIRVQQ